MNPQVFSLRRFGDVLRRDVRMELSTWLWRVIAMVAVMTLINLFLAWFASNIEKASTASGFKLQGIFITYACWMYTSIFTTLGASHFMQGYATPGQRLSQLMSPASTLEKYVSRLCISVVAVTLLMIGAWYVAEMVRVAVFTWASDGADVHPVMGWWSAMRGMAVMPEVSMPFPFEFLLMSVLAWQSAYVLGSALWLKNAFLKTLGAAMVLEFFYGFAGGCTVSLVEDMSLPSVDISLTALRVVAVAFLVICILFCYITTYFRMREEEIIQRM